MADARYGSMAPTLAQRFALAVGVVFLLVGILGFIPGITTNYSDMEFAGHDSGAELLGIFQVSILHNIVHVLFGLIGLWAARESAQVSIAYLIAGGIVYGVLALYGAVVDSASDANFVPLNTADNWLHLALAVGMVALGLVARAELTPRAPGRARTA